jgi:tRNA (guanine-N7-)-methyltransferase
MSDPSLKRNFSRARVREHVNPFCIEFQQPVEIPDWQAIYATCDRPIHLDIGCGRGRFLLKMAAVEPEWNFLGLEIRRPLVIEANQWRDWQNLRNLHYVFCNANNALRSLLASLPPGRLERVSIQFPDPWFKRRHQKRRVVQDALVDDIALFLAPGGLLFLQSDVLEVASEMRDRGLAHPAFSEQQPGWLPQNPFPIATEREFSTLSRGEPVYRTILCRRDSDAVSSAN